MPKRADKHLHPRLGRYELVGRIATGGMATVYMARLQGSGGFNREFALKVIHPHLAEQEGFTERFTREARLASRVRHHNIVSTVDAGQALGYSYLVLELVEGPTLRQLIVRRDRPFEFVEAAQIIADAARGLHALHTATDDKDEPLHIVHRDLSPHNIMIDRHGRTVLIDLGLAKAEHNDEQTQVGVMLGKLPYMSPEQSRLEPLDARSDVFALGTVLFELCTNEMPFGDSHTTKTLERLNACETGPIARKLNELGAPRWLVEIILSCLQADPDDRYPTAEDVAAALAQALSHAGYDAADNRQRLAEIVSETWEEIGAVTPVSGIVPRVPERESAAGWAWWRWAVAGALVVGAGWFGLQRAGLLDARTAAPTPREEPAGLASDAASVPVPTSAAIGTDPPPGTRPRATKSTSPDPDPSDAGTAGAPETTDTEGAASTGAAANPRRRPRRRPRPDPDAPRLKPNPYADP